MNMLVGLSLNPRVEDPVRSRGYALVTAMLMLVICAFLGMSVYRGLGLQGRIAGNTMDKERSFQAAESTLRFGEWWLTQGLAGTGVACSGVYDANTVSAMRACTVALTPATAAQLPWSTGGTYTPPLMNVSMGGGQTGGDANYALSPMVHVAYVGPGPDGKSQLYQVSSVAYGGSASTATVLQSVYSMTQKTRNLGEP